MTALSLDVSSFVNGGANDAVPLKAALLAIQSTINALDETNVSGGKWASKALAPTAGIVEGAPSAALAATSWADIAGASVSVTPAVTSKLLVSWVANLRASGSPAAEAALALALDTSRVGLVRQWKAPSTADQRLSLSGLAVVQLSAAAHTIKLRGCRASWLGVTLEDFAISYQLVADAGAGASATAAWVDPTFGD
jgi:hypothetical protein